MADCGSVESHHGAPGRHNPDLVVLDRVHEAAISGSEMTFYVHSGLDRHPEGVARSRGETGELLQLVLGEAARDSWPSGSDHGQVLALKQGPFAYDGAALFQVSCGEQTGTLR